MRSRQVGAPLQFVPRRRTRAIPPRRQCPMAKAIRFHEPGGPDVLRLETLQSGAPAPGQVRLRHKAIGLNYADTYFRNGTYAVPLPSGIGLEAAGIVEEVGPCVENVKAGEAVVYNRLL